MSEVDDDGDVYKLYAVVVHVDMLNASYFGHYICYTKDSSGNWYRIDDSKVLAYFFFIINVLPLSYHEVHFSTHLCTLYVDKYTSVIVSSLN